VFFFKDEWLSALFEALAISIEDDVGHVPQADSNFAFGRVKHRTDGQSHEIVRIRQRIGFVEIVDAPDQASEAIPPRPETRNVQIPTPSTPGALFSSGQSCGNSCAHL
jgi:hypothetical protein